MDPVKGKEEKMGLRLADGQDKNIPHMPTVWTAEDVMRFFRLPSEDMARRRIAKLERGGAKVRVPEAVAGRRLLVYARRLLEAAGLSEEEMRAVLGAS
jgi:hypothetical protein